MLSIVTTVVTGIEVNPLKDQLAGSGVTVSGEAVKVPVAVNCTAVDPLAWALAGVTVIEANMRFGDDPQPHIRTAAVIKTVGSKLRRGMDTSN